MLAATLAMWPGGCLRRARSEGMSMASRAIFMVALLSAPRRQREGGEFGPPLDAVRRELVVCSSSPSLIMANCRSAHLPRRAPARPSWRRLRPRRSCCRRCRPRRPGVRGCPPCRCACSGVLPIATTIGFLNGGWVTFGLWKVMVRSILSGWSGMMSSVVEPPEARGLLGWWRGFGEGGDLAEEAAGGVHLFVPGAGK